MPMPMSAAGCVFCEIVAGHGEVSPVHEDDESLAFMDIRPINAGHVVVVPKVHAARLAELDPGSAGHLMQVAQTVARWVCASGVRCEGVNLLLADGKVAGQEVGHIHLHVVPRFEGDGFRFKFGPNYGRRPTRKELAETAEMIRDAGKPRLPSDDRR